MDSEWVKVTRPIQSKSLEQYKHGSMDDFILYLFIKLLLLLLQIRPEKAME